MIKRSFDIIFSIFGLVFFLPVFLILIVIIKIDSNGPAFYKQTRVGRYNRDFSLYKFRSMRVNSDKGGLLTVGGKDSRITKAGYFIRKYKLDELPQMINVLKGEMSFVGPRPEVRKYVEMYDEKQLKVLNVRPGITDNASIKYKNENDILHKSENPEELYIKIILPDKLNLNLEYINDRSFFKDLKIIFRTIKEIFV